MPKLPRPEGHHVVTPACIVPGASKVIAFMEKVFGGKVVERYEGPGGTVMHAEVMVGDSAVMLGDAQPDMDPMPAVFSLYVDDGPAVDATYKRALDAGAKSERGPEDQFYGYRSAVVRDSGGNRWTICAVVEDLTREQIAERMAKMQKQN